MGRHQGQRGREGGRPGSDVPAASPDGGPVDIIIIVDDQVANVPESGAGRGLTVLASPASFTRFTGFTPSALVLSSGPESDSGSVFPVSEGVARLDNWE